VTSTADPSGVSTAAKTTGKHAADPSLGQLVSEASTQISALVRSEVELAKLELRSSVKNATVGVGFFAVAAVLLVFSLVFGFLTLAEGINAAGLSRWLSFLIVFGFQLLVVGGAAYLGIKKVKRVKAPQRTISTSKDTVAYLQSNIKRR
jgi:uncharacterized membrane protein YqjE